MNLWTRMFGPRIDAEGIKKALDAFAEKERLEYDNARLKERIAFRAELDRLNVAADRDREKVQTSAVCPGCVARKETIDTLQAYIVQLEGFLRERDETLSRYHGAGFDRAMAERETEIARLSVLKASHDAQRQAIEKDPDGDADQERGAHAGNVTFQEPTGPAADPTLDEEIPF